jgi:hypothetical protein
MKAAELISRLQQIVDEYGDCEIEVNQYERWDHELITVSYDHKYNEIVLNDPAFEESIKE